MPVYRVIFQHVRHATTFEQRVLARDEAIANKAGVRLLADHLGSRAQAEQEWRYLRTELEPDSAAENS